MLFLKPLSRMICRAACGRTNTQARTGRRRPSQAPTLETLESRWCPTLTLTPAGIARGFGISIFAVDFPSNNNVGPVGIGFPNSGGVLVSDSSGNVRLFPTDVNGQSADWFPPTVHDITNGPNDIAKDPAGNLYMTYVVSGKVAQVNDDGTEIQVIASGLPHAEGIVYDSISGHLLVALYDNNQIVDVDPNTGTVTPYVSTSGNVDGLTISGDGTRLYAAVTNGHIVGFDTTSPTHDMVFDSGFIPGGVDGVAEGIGTLTGNLYVNCNDGTVVEVNVSDPTQTVVVADHGSRGDFVKVDQILNDGSVFFTQTDRIVRLTFPSGGSPSRGGGPASRLDREHLAVLSLPIDLTLSNSPSLASPGQIGGENALPPLEQTVLVGLNVGSASTAQGRGVLDTLFAAHHKDSHWLDVEGWDAFTQDLASGLR